ncbi:MAG TPA: hypothetical protein VKQ08_10450, partial [Cyclobacteriaceae bacterium]|nr:hypothetical protein [Cyclobacteriaceae bacterium]
MLSEIIDFESWTAPSTVSLAQSITKKKEVSNDKRSAISWKHFKDELSPLSLYIYLKARFGKPNGIAMIGWQPRIKNIIHWHYTIHCHSSTINFWGHSSGLEIMIASPENLENGDRETFITALKNDFSKHGKEMGEIKKQLDQWSIFINPFVRLNQTLHHLTDELEDIDLSEPRALPPDHTDQDLRSFLDDTKVWIKNTTKAAALGTAIRMLFPVVVESFINLFIYIFRKQELKVDPRLYENQIRQQIDIRAKSLHMTCDGLTSPIDGNDPRFKAFHTLMNGRNDFLHGNIDPVRMQLEDIYFDATFIPIYKEDDGIIKKMIPKYLAHVSLAEVQKDERVVNDFMDMVFEKLEESSFQTFYELFSERFPGINKNTQEIRPVVSDDFAEGYATFSRKAEDDPSYQLFLNDETTFELYIPATWQHFREENRHYFHPYERHNPENLIVSVLNNQEGRSFIDSRIKGREEKKMGKKKFYLLASPKDLHVNSYFHFSENDTQFALFTYTYPERLDPDLES